MYDCLVHTYQNQRQSLAEMSNVRVNAQLVADMTVLLTYRGINVHRPQMPENVACAATY